MKLPVLYLIVPCYNEEAVLGVTSGMFLGEIDSLVSLEKISPDSRVLFVDDGSADRTWEIITDLSRKDERFIGIRQSRNRGHQNAVLAGMMEARGKADAVVSVDCDGQDDITAVGRMVDEYLSGCDIVYGVRSSRKSDTFFKRFTAERFYKLLEKMGVETVFNHADYRLVSARALDAFADFHEVNLFLRGMFPLVGFKTASVEYERKERIAGESHYPLKKMLSLAGDGITSLSVKPLRMIAVLGIVCAILSLAGLITALVFWATGANASIAAVIAAVFFVGAVQLICVGVLGEYIGKIYMEVKGRPRYIISDRTWDTPRGAENDVKKEVSGK